MIENNVIAVIEAIEKMLPPLRQRMNHAAIGAPTKATRGARKDATTFAVAIRLITHETGNDGASANMV